jgi:RNA polymerase sigma-70 factor (ECF subfamily)
MDEGLPGRRALGAADGELALLAASGDRRAFEALVERHAGLLLSVLEQRVGDHHQAHDLAQEVWLKVYRAIGRFRPDGSFRSWLFTIAFNHLRDALRGRGRERIVYLDDYRSPLAAPERANPSGPTEERAAIQECLARVPEPFRSAVTLVDVLGLSYEEAARALACAVGTIKPRVNRGRWAFRDAYKQLDCDTTGLCEEPDLSGTMP